jgi:hypothetical protein
MQGKKLVNLDNNLMLKSENIEYNNDTLKNTLDKIIESGSNDNGRWIKYSDGTLIQYGNVTKSVNIKNKSNETGWYYDDGYAVNFPINFSDTNYFTEVKSVTSNIITLNIYSITNFRNSICEFNLSCNVEYNNSNYKFRWFAIGRWK